MNESTVVFDSHVNGFARVEYLSVFVALLYAFAVAEFFIGWAKMLRNRDTIIFSIDHLVFSLVYFWILIINWYTLWAQIKFLDQGFFYFIITLIPIVITYIASVFIFPDLDKVRDLNVYFDKNFNTVTVLTCIFMLTTMAIQIWEAHLDVTSPFVLFRTINGVFMLTVAVFNLNKLRRLMLLFIIVGLFIGSYSLAFI